MSSGGDMSQFAYGMAFGIGILAIVLLVTVSCCCCLRDHSREFISARMALQHLDALSGTAADRGIDEATLQSYPTVLFSSVKHLEKNNLADSSDVIGGGSCSICLGEYKEGDLLRLLPVCGHLFHMKCVDPWLRLHATCPVCRRSSVGQLGQPRLESQTVAVTVDGDLHSGDSMVKRYDRGLQIPFPQFKSGFRKVVLRKRIRWKNASVTFTERKH